MDTRPKPTTQKLLNDAYTRTGFTRLEMCRKLDMGTNVLRDLERGFAEAPESINEQIRRVAR